jgi:hypothetical protein
MNTVISKTAAVVLMSVSFVVSLIAQQEIPMSAEKGNITLLFDNITTNGTFSTLQGSIRNDTPNELISLDFEVVGYDQDGIDVRMCDASNTGARCQFHISTPLQSGHSVRISPGVFYPGRPISKKRHMARVEWRVIAAHFTPLPAPDPTLSFAPNEGDIVVWDITFITDWHPMLSFRLANHTPYVGSDSTPGFTGIIRIKLQADGLCEGKPTQWTSDDWIRPHNFKYYKSLWMTTNQASSQCEVQSFKGQLLLDADSALSNAYQFSLPLRIDVEGEANGSNVLVFHVKARIPRIIAQQAADKKAADAAKAEQDAKDAAEAAVRAQEEQQAAKAQAKKDAADAARRAVSSAGTPPAQIPRKERYTPAPSTFQAIRK